MCNIQFNWISWYQFDSYTLIRYKMNSAYQHLNGLSFCVEYRVQLCAIVVAKMLMKDNDKWLSGERAGGNILTCSQPGATFKLATVANAVKVRI